MKKVLKIALFIFLGSVILLGILTVAARLYFTPERVKAMIETRISEKLGRQAKLGQVSIGLFSGFTVTDFALSEAPDFSQGTFLSSQLFSVRPQLLPLLRKELFVDRLTLVHPEITVIRQSDGKTFNFSSLAGSTATAAGPASSNSTSPFAFLVSKISIESGRLYFVDKSTAAQSAEIDNLNLLVRNVTLVAPVELRTDFNIRTKTVDAAVDFEGSVWAIKGSAKIKRLIFKSGNSLVSATGDLAEVTGKNPRFDLKIAVEKLEPALLAALGALPTALSVKDPLAGKVDLKGTMESVDSVFKLTLGPLAVSGQGTVKNAVDAKRSFAIDVQTNAAPVASLLALAPPDTLPKDVKLSGNVALSLKANGTTEAGAMDLAVDGKDLEVAYSTDFKKLAGSPLSVGIKGRYALPLALDMESVSLGLGSMKIAGKGFYKSTNRKNSYSFDLKSNDFPLEEIAPMVAALRDYGLSGKASTSMKVAGTAASPDVKGTAELSGVALAVHGATISNIVSSIHYTMKDVSGQLTADSVRHAYFTGSALDVKWSLKEAADPAKMAGTANLKIGQGDFENIQKLTSDSKAAKILFLPLTLLQKIGGIGGGALKLPDFNKVAYKQMAGEFAFGSGVMTIKRFDMDGSIGAHMKGTVGLVGAQPLHLDPVSITTPGVLGGTLGKIFNNELGRPTIRLRVDGTVEAPKVDVDLSVANREALNVIKDKVADEPLEEVEKLLKGLFKR